MKKALLLIVVIMLASVGISAQGRLLFKQQRRKPGVVQVGPPTTYLKKGLTSGEVLRLLGEPANISERNDGDQVLTTYVFLRGEQRVLVADFVGDALVSYRIEPRMQVALVTR